MTPDEAARIVADAASSLNRLAAERVSSRLLQELFDDLSDEARDMLRYMLDNALP